MYHLINVVLLYLKRRLEPFFVCFVFPEIDTSQKEALATFNDRLMTDLELNGVLRGLLKEQIFTKTLNFEVMKRPGPERVGRLIELLSYRGHHAFRAFCRVLKDMSEVELAYGLLKEAYRREEEIFW